MQTVPTQLSDVIYNAATQSFEALVTIHDANEVRSYDCAIEAPITMDFQQAAKGLTTQALRRHSRGQAASVLKPAPHGPRAHYRTIWRRYILEPLHRHNLRAA
ncbi:MAG: orotidine 5-phosphate decarboxylase [Pseudomonadota bacterium]